MFFANSASKVLTHAGSNGYWYAVTWLVPNRDSGYLAATNRGNDMAVQACDAAVAELIETLK